MAVLVSRDASQPAGLPCPQCGTAIRASARELLSGTPIVCSNCGLQLRIDAARSVETLRALEEFQAALDGVEARVVKAAEP